MIKASIVADSICNGHRITTMLVTMPRFILAEFNTHRMLSKNSASSRAIPLNKMIEMVERNPFVPIAWQKKHSGMQGEEYITDKDLLSGLNREWLSAKDQAVAHAYNIGVHATKQLCNRLLEPFMYHTVLVTATEWENFWHLRCPQYYTLSPENQISRSWKDLVESLRVGGEILGGDVSDLIEAYKKMSVVERLQHNKGQAEIHMMATAEAMWDAYNESTPKELKPGEWHMPYAPTDFGVADHLYGKMTSSLEENTKMMKEAQLKIATARCAQTSYTVMGEDGKPSSYEVLLDVFGSLAIRPYTNRKGKVFGEDDPVHMTPLEHCAQAMTDEQYMRYGHATPYENTIQPSASQVEYGWCKNFRGWIQFRAMFPNENRRQI